LSNRGGKGIKTATITERNGNVVCITTVTGEEDLMIVTNGGVIIRLDVQDISQNGRAAQGVRLMRLGNEQFVSTVAKVQNDSEDDEQSEAMTDDNKLTNDSEEVIEIVHQVMQFIQRHLKQNMKIMTIHQMMIVLMLDKILWIV